MCLGAKVYRRVVVRELGAAAVVHVAPLGSWRAAEARFMG